MQYRQKGGKYSTKRIKGAKETEKSDNKNQKGGRR